MADFQFLDLQGLTNFKDLMTAYIDEKDAASIKGVALSPDGTRLLFYKEEPISGATAQYEVELPGPDLSGLTARVTANEAAISTLNGGETTAGSVRKTVADALAAIVAGAPESLDTLKEISDWISGHASDAASMNSNITANTSAISSLQTAVDTINNSTTGILAQAKSYTNTKAADTLAAAKTYTNELADGQVNTNKTNIAANTASISANTSNISKNTAAITALQASVNGITSIPAADIEKLFA